MNLINTCFNEHNLGIYYAKYNYTTYTPENRTRSNSKVHEPNCKFNNCSCSVVYKTDNIK